MESEHELQNQIREALSPMCVLFRINVGRMRTPDGRYFSTGVDAGFSDLFGYRREDGRAVFIEVKTPRGKPSKAQEHFLEVQKRCGAIAGIAHSVEEALKLVCPEFYE